MVDPTAIDGEKITIRNDWTVSRYSKDDNIIFTSDEKEKAFKVEGDNPLKVITFE